MRCAVLLAVLLVSTMLVVETEGIFGGFFGKAGAFLRRICRCKFERRVLHCICKLGKRSLDKRDDGNDVCTKDVDIPLKDEFETGLAMVKAMDQMIEECKAEDRRSAQ